jgi:hypothetical protein
VILTAGVLATNIGLGKTSTIQIVQAVGGSTPTIPGNQTNVTGFYIDALGTAQKQLARMSGPVLVLYDNSSGSPSNNIYSQLDQTKVRPLTAQTADDLNNLDPTKLNGINGFMILPNAWFYRYDARIVHYVDGKKKGDGTPLPIYYPEREYKNAHNTKTRVSVLGHSVLITYCLAAHYVNNILTGYWTTLPGFQEAVQDSSF